MNPANIWRQVVSPLTDELRKATAQYHHASQFIALVGKSLLPAKPDDSQTTMEWWSDWAAFSGKRIPASDGFRLGLNTQRFSLVFYQDVRHPVQEIFLEGLSRDQVLQAVKEGVSAFGENADGLSHIEHYEIPDHPLMHGAPFEAPGREVQSILASYRSNADILLAECAVKFPQAESVRIWPHHFDSGVFIPIKSDDQGNLTRSVSMGMAIPDEAIPDYYFYVNPWQKSGEIPKEALPKFAGMGEWHTTGWVGAILKMGELSKLASGPEQHRRAREFFESALAASLTLMKT